MGASEHCRTVALNRHLLGVGQDSPCHVYTVDKLGNKLKMIGQSEAKGGC